MPHRTWRAMLAALAFTALSPLHAMPVAPATEPASASAPAEADDPFLWLEDVQGERALAWVRERNAESQKELQARPEFAPLRARLLSLLNSKERIPRIVRRGDWLYNFWQDETHKRGLWRRATLAEYRKPQPAWDVLLDLDALGRAENENWVWAGANCLAPENRHCLLSLSRGGADAKVVREFDIEKKAFVAGGFVLPEAKSQVDWVDANTLYVGTDFGPGSLTDSGYPRVIKRWKRGTPLAEAATVFEAQSKDVSASVSVDLTPGFERTVFSRSLDFFHEKRFLATGDRDKRVELDLPDDASYNFWNHVGGKEDTLLIELRSDLVTPSRTFPRGSLLATDAHAYLAGLGNSDASAAARAGRRYEVLFEPTATRSLAGYTTTRSRVIVDVLDNVASKLEEWQRTPDGFTRREIKAPFPGTLGVAGLTDPLLRKDPLAEHYLLTYADFLTPDSLLLGHTGSDERELLKALPAGFDASGMHTDQFFATSKDGTRVPYFVVWPKGGNEKGATASTAADGTTPTLLYGYGGFEISMQPWYAQSYGGAWVERGGALVVANIRGGGEFGPAWHQAAVKANKQRSYDDFIAVAEDLIGRKITSPKHLGIAGGSNGGLLVGAVFTQRPELFNAVVCQVPLLDMKRYHLLLAGASWMAEYGNPDDPADWATIARFSPYQNVRPDQHYPKVLFTTSTRDDRVHPGHARKMAARMLAQGHPVFYYENIEGGHGGAADNEQRAQVQALEFSYLWQQLGR